MRFVINGKLPGLNEYTLACRKNRYAGNAMKRKAEELVIWSARSQLKGWKPKHPVYMVYKWVEPNKRRDKDNISAAGRKFIQDALVKAGVLDDDGWDNIVGFEDKFAVDKKHPHIEVELMEVSHELQ